MRTKTSGISSSPSAKPSKRGLLMHINDGVGYYRHILPMKYLSRLAWNFAYPKFDYGKTDWDGFNKEFGHTRDELDSLRRNVDILVTQRNDVPMYIAYSQLTQAIYKIPWVYDNDDNVHAIKATNFGFQSYNPQSRHPKWAIKAMESAFALTVSTEELKRVYAKTNKRIYVLPNGLDMELWDKAAVEPKPEGEVRISLMLAGAHFEDILEIEPVLIEILKRYPQVRLYVMDSFRHDLFKKVPKEHKHQLVWQKWIDGKDWISWCKKMDFDIGLAPLLDNDFNRAKSNLRLLEYGAQSLAVVASPVEPYKLIINQGLAVGAATPAEWFDALCSLLDKPYDAATMGTALYDHVKEKFDMKVLAQEYDRVYSEIVKEFRATYGQPLGDGQLPGTTQHSVDTAIHKLADDITAHNTGRKKTRF